MSEPTSTTATTIPDDSESRRVTDPLGVVSNSEAKSVGESPDADQASSSTSKTTASNPDEEGLIKEMKNFDNLLKMMSVYRDNPDLRGNPNDRNIEEIAKVLSNFIGDDPDGFLRDEEDGQASESEGEGDNQVTSNGDSNPHSGGES